MTHDEAAATGEVFGEVTALPADLVDAPITDADPFAWLELEGQRYRVGMAELKRAAQDDL